MSEIRDRAREIYDLAVEAGVIVKGVTKVSPTLESLGKFAALARKQEREANCKAICIGCANTNLWGVVVLDDGYWVHRSFNPAAELPCEARNIHERNLVETGG